MFATILEQILVVPAAGEASSPFSTLLGDVGAYYTSQGKFADNLSQMTNVSLDPATGKVVNY